MRDEALQWIAEHAHELATADPDQPLADLKPLEAMLADAVIVGIGETTRAGHEVVSLGHRVLRLLVENLGFRVLAIQDSERAVSEVDTYLRTGDGDPLEAMSELWPPWRTKEMLDVVAWARSFNEQHPTDRLRIVGLDPITARPSDYQDVVDHVANAGSHLVDQLRQHYGTIVTAHEVPEHVQHARGSHPGRRFVDQARDAYELVASLPPSAATTSALDKARLIVDFHATSFVGGGFDYDAVRRRSVAAMTSLPRGTKIAYWEGIAFTANANRVDPVALLEPFQSVGNELRRQLGEGYFSLLIEFGHGDISGLHTGQHAPPPMTGSVDADLSSAGPDRYLLDLRAPRDEPVADWLRGPHKLRVIGGIYDAAADADHYLTIGPLDEWFDGVLHVRSVTPTTLR